MLWGVAYTEAALKSLKEVPAKFRKQIKVKVSKLESEPYPQGCKKLLGVTDGENGVYRLRSGDYRVLYVVRNNPDQIVVLDIDHRKDVYR